MEERLSSVAATQFIGVRFERFSAKPVPRLGSARHGNAPGWQRARRQRTREVLSERLRVPRQTISTKGELPQSQQSVCVNSAPYSILLLGEMLSNDTAQGLFQYPV
jgi:hypothetical protein